MYKTSLLAKNQGLANEWHPTKNEGLNAPSITAMSGRKVCGCVKVAMSERRLSRIS